MTPEDIKILAETLGTVLKSEELNNGPFWVLICILITGGPLAARYAKRAHEKSVKAIMESSNENFNKMLKQQEEQMDKVIYSMAMYTEEVVAIHANHNELKEKVIKVENRVNKHQTWLEKLKDKC